MIRLVRLSLSVAFLLALSQPLSAACVARNATDSAPAINSALSSAGPGGIVYLCRSTTYPIKSAIRFQYENQSLFTETFDTGNTDLSQRAWIDISDPGLTTAVIAHDVPGSWLKWVQVWGSRDRYGVGAGAMLDFGGTVTTSSNGRTQEVAGCYLTGTRGWTSLSVSAGTGGCTNVKIQNNDIGSSGMPDGTWADGISYQCRNGYVTGNYIYDATDGGIVVFGAPGSLIADNTIEAINRELLGGINLVDDGPFRTAAGDGDYRGTRVYHNTIKASGAFIHIAIASGPYVWFPRDTATCPEAVVRNDGALIDYNTITGQFMGFGFAVDGVRNWTITNNTATSSHVYFELPQFCSGPVSIPRRYQKYSARSSGTFSGNSAPFIEAILEGAVGISW